MMTNFKKMTQTIRDLGSLLATSEYAQVSANLALPAEILTLGPELVATMEQNYYQRTETKGRKQVTVADKKQIMRHLRQIRSDLGAIMRLNFAGSPLLVILGMQTRYKTVVDTEDNRNRKPTYDRRNSSERAHFKLLLENLASLPDVARNALAGAGWTDVSETELRENFAILEAACKEQKLLEGQITMMADRGRNLLEEATRWYRNVRIAARSLRRRMPELAGLIDRAFPQADANRPRQAVPDSQPQTVLIQATTRIPRVPEEDEAIETGHTEPPANTGDPNTNPEGNGRPIQPDKTPEVAAQSQTEPSEPPTIPAALTEDAEIEAIKQMMRQKLANAGFATDPLGLNNPMGLKQKDLNKQRQANRPPQKSKNRQKKRRRSA